MTLNRRQFVTYLGKGAIAVAVLGPVAACSDASGDTAGATDPAPGTTTTPTTTAATAAAATTTTAAGATTTAPATGAAPTWARVDLGFVSAYVVARGDEAAVVDTGVSGSAGAIEGVVTGLGLGWEAVGHVVLTHYHGDHVGSIGEVLAAATSATAYAGAADIDQIDSPQPLQAVADGDTVFGLQIIATPGHTPGHISVLDPGGGFLIAGDAMNGGDAMGGAARTVAGPNPDFTPDMATANQSVQKLAGLTFDTVLFGHGEPVEGNADEAVAALATDL